MRRKSLPEGEVAQARRGSRGGSTRWCNPSVTFGDSSPFREPQSRPEGQQRMREKFLPERGGGAKRRRGSHGGGIRWCNPSVTFGDSSPFRGAISRPERGSE